MKKRMGRRLAAFCLTLCMLLMLLPTAAFAAGGVPDWAQSTVDELNEKYDQGLVTTTAIPGTAVSFCTYTYSTTDETTGQPATGSVLIFGVNEGGADTVIPDTDLWENVGGISDIYITDGVTGIADGAFRYAGNLSTLENIYIADTVTSIGENAFANNAQAKFNGLAEGDKWDLSGVTIGEGAFQGCAGLAYVNIILSNKRDIGANTFNGCGLASVTFTGNGGMKAIGTNAFAGNHLGTIEIPAGVTTIGSDAFSGNDFTSITLPESLTTIGDRAFYTETANTTMQSLTIPAGVISIGSAAFNNYTGLETVTVEGTGAITIGDTAFGNSADNAYSDTTTLTVQTMEGEETELEINIGTTILTRNETVAGCFVSGQNCYLGDVVSYVYDEDRSVAPTCTEGGRDVYVLTIRDGTGQEETRYLYERTRDALGHSWLPSDTYDATCEFPQRTAIKCERCHVEQEGWEAVEGGQTAIRHNYQLVNMYSASTDATDASFSADKTSTLVFRCVNDAHTVPPDTLDKEYTFQVAGKTIALTATDRLGSVSSDTLKLDDRFSLSWNYDAIEPKWINGGGSAGETSTLRQGTYQIPVILHENSTVTTLPDESATIYETQTNLTVTVTVSTVDLDFTNTTISNTERYQGQTQDAAAVVNGPTGQGVTFVKLQYLVDGQWVDSAPAQSAAGSYQVRAVYTYDPDIYHIDKTKHGTGYTIETGENNQAYLIHAYTITSYSTADIAITARNPQYTGEAQDVFSVTNVPAGATITYTIFRQTGEDTWETVGEANQTYTVPTGGDTIVTVPFGQTQGLTDAGTYQLKISVDLNNTGFEGEPIVKTGTGSITPKPISLPTPASSLYYNGSTQAGVTVTEDYTGIYTLTGNTGTDAGTYAATATIINSNYCWPDSSTEAKITWNIQKRTLTAPTVKVSLTYNDSLQELLNLGNFDYVVLYVDDAGGNTQTAYVYHEDVAPANVNSGSTVQESVITSNSRWAMCLSPAKAKNAGTYTVELTLWDTNYQLNSTAGLTQQGEAENGYLRYTFNQKVTINRATPEMKPTISVTSFDYIGTAIQTNQIAIDTAGCDTSIFDTNSVTYTFYRGAAAIEGNKISQNDVVSAGQYYVTATFTSTAAGNYNTTIGTAFYIRQKGLSMSASESAQTAEYTANGTALQTPVVTGIVDADLSAQNLYTLSYSYKYSADPVDNWNEITDSTSIKADETLKDVGYYQVTISMSVPASGSNYTAAASVSYTLTITAASQGITLTPGTGTNWDDGHAGVPDYQITKTLGDEPFTVTGTGTVDPASVMTYTAAEGQNVITLNGAEVTLKQAGETTVTVSTQGTANAGAGSVKYTVVVNPADAQLSLSPQTFEYSGQPITNYQNATYTDAENGAEKVDTTKITYTFYEYTDGEKGANLSVAPTDVGTYWLEAALDGDPNYTSDPARNTVTITPNSSGLTVASVKYEGTYDGSGHDLKGLFTDNTVTGLDGQPVAYTVAFATTDTDAAPAADADGIWKDSLSVRDVADSTGDTLYYWYKVTPTSGNYAEKIGRIPVDISPATLTLSSDLGGTLTKAYDGKDSFGGTVTIGTPTGVYGEDADITATAAYADKNVGTGGGYAKDIIVTYTIQFKENMAGNYQYTGSFIKGTGDEDTWVYTETKTGEGSITPRQITVTGVTAENREYDGTTSVTLTGTPVTDDTLFNGEGLGLQLTGTAGTAANGSYTGSPTMVTTGTNTVEITGEGKENYVITDVNDPEMTILQRTVTLKFTGTMIHTYDSDPVPETVYAATMENTLADEPHTGTTLYTFYTDASAQDSYKLDAPPTNVGTYWVVASLDAAGNYTGATTEPTQLTITPASASLTVTATGYSDTYDGEAHDAGTLTVQGGDADLPARDYQVYYSTSGEIPVNEENLSEYSDDMPQVTNVDDSKTVYYLVVTDNYGRKAGSFTTTVSKAELTLSSDLTTSKIYNGTTDATVETPAIGGIVNKENITVTAMAAYDNANAGTGKTITTTYTVAFGEGALPNNYTYDGSFTANQDNTWKVTTTVSNGAITPKGLTVTINEDTATAVYDGDTPELTGVTWGDLSSQLCDINGDDTKDNPQITLNFVETDVKNAGSYTLTAKAGNGNYKVETLVNGSFTITRRPVTATLQNGSGYYGEALPSLNTLVRLEAADADRGLIQGESLDLSSYITVGQAGSTANAGDYPVSAPQNPVNEGNYAVTFTGSGTYTIQSRPITVTIKDQSSDYGCAIVSGINSGSGSTPATEDTHYTVALGSGSGLTGSAMVNDDTLTVVLTTTATSSSDVGSYAITGAATIDDGNSGNNYAVTFLGEGGTQNQAAYTIEKADLTIAFANNNRGTVGIPFASGYRNKLIFTNASSDTQIMDISVFDGHVTYTLTGADPAGFAAIDAATGALTISQPGQGTIGVTVTATGNYNAPEDTWYTLLVVRQGAGLTVEFAPQSLTYTGAPQALLGDESVRDGNNNPLTEGEDYTIQYRLTVEDGVSVENPQWTEEIPMGTDAGTYTVEYQILATGYTPTPTAVTVTIAPAELRGFEKDALRYSAYTSGMTIDQDDNPFWFQILVGDQWTNVDFKGTVKYTTPRDDVATVTGTDNSQYTVTMLHETDSTGIPIQAAVSGDDNFVSRTYTYTLTVNASAIVPEVDGDGTFTYDGKPHSLAVTVPTLDEAGEVYTVVYGTEAGSYTTSVCPAYTDVGSYTIYYQVRPANSGYNTAQDQAVITIQAKSINAETTPGTPDITVVGPEDEYTYMGGQEIRPPVTVTDRVTGQILAEGTDYTLTYANNTAISTEGNPAAITITGTGNYCDVWSQTLTFQIVSVRADYLRAQLTESYGVLAEAGGSGATTVQVFHGNEQLNPGGGEDTFAITVTGTDFKGGSIDGSWTVDNGTGELTFQTPGIYRITVEVTGNHAGTFYLDYTLLPVQSADGLRLSAGDDAGVRILTYGDTVAAEDRVITVTLDGAELPADAANYTLRYVYTPFAGETETGDYTQDVLAGTPAAGVYEVTATGGENHPGSTGSFVFLVQKRDLSDSDVSADINDQVYSGSALEPEAALTYQGGAVGALEQTRYYNNTDAGLGQAVSTAAVDNNNFTGTRVDSFTIARKDIADTTIAIAAEPAEYPFTGGTVTPTAVITDSQRGGETLSPGVDYTVTSTAKDPGPAAATVEGRGNYTGTAQVSFTITSEPVPGPDETFTLTLSPDSGWVYGRAPAELALSVTFGEGNELTLGTDYTLTVNGVTYNGADGGTLADAVAAIKALKPGGYTVTAQGMGRYGASSDTASVTVSKVPATVDVAASPSSLSGGGTVTLTLRGTDLPEGTDLTKLLAVSAANGTELALDELEWTRENGVWTAAFDAANANETYTFTLSFAGDDCYQAASDTATVVTARTSSGGGGSTTYIIEAAAGQGGSISPSGRVSVVRGQDAQFSITPDEGYRVEDVLVDGESVGAVTGYLFENVTGRHTISVTFTGAAGVADPDDTGVSGRLNTRDHFAYLQGYPGNRFGPDDNMTRAQAAQMFYNLLLDQDVAGAAAFDDVAPDAWYAEAVEALASLGIVEGVGGGMFAPERVITRAEFTVIAMRFARLETGGENPFSDVSADDWFYDYVVGSAQYGWITGYADGTFRPNSTITRAEVTAITNRMLNRAADRDYVDGHSGGLTRFDDVSAIYWAYYDIMEAVNGHDYERENGAEDWTSLQP